MLSQSSHATTATTNFSATRSYHDLATMGYAAHASSLTDVQAQARRNGLNWLCGPSPEIAGEPAPIVFFEVCWLRSLFFRFPLPEAATTLLQT